MAAGESASQVSGTAGLTRDVEGRVACQSRPQGGIPSLRRVPTFVPTLCIERLLLDVRQFC